MLGVDPRRIAGALTDAGLQAKSKQAMFKACRATCGSELKPVGQHMQCSQQKVAPALSAMVLRGILRAVCRICTPTAWSKFVSLSLTASRDLLAYKRATPPPVCHRHTTSAAQTCCNLLLINSMEGLITAAMSNSAHADRLKPQDTLCIERLACHALIACLSC